MDNYSFFKNEFTYILANMQLSLNMKKYNQAIFNNFRRNRGSIYVRYHVMLNGQWYPVDNKIAIMPKCIYTMPPIDVRVDFKNSWVFEAFDKHELLPNISNNKP